MIKRVLQINKFLFRHGGSESYLFNLAALLEKQGIAVEFWGMADERNAINDTYGTFANGIDFRSQELVKKLKAGVGSIYSWRNRRKLAKLLDVFKPDIVHVHNFNYQLTPAILAEIKLRNIRVIYTAHDSQFACPSHRIYNPQKNEICPKCITGRFRNCALNRCIDGSYLKSLIGMLESYLYHNTRYYERHIDLVVSPSRFLASIIRRAYSGRIAVIPNFVTLRPSQTVQKDDYILYFGRISKEKGIAKMSMLFEEKRIPLVIIGDGPDVGALKTGRYVRYLGAQYGETLYGFVRRAKCVLQPANGYENCPMAVLESFACGTPVIAPAHSGFMELIEHGKTGFLFDFGNSDLMKAINRAYHSCDVTLSENCISTYKTRFSEDIHVDRIMQCYRGLL